MPKDIVRRDHAPNLFTPPKHAAREKDYWGVDIFHEEKFRDRYDDSFGELLRDIGVSSFSELLSNRKRDHLGSNVLDLMGGAYFVGPDDYPVLDSITGFRLDNPEAAFVQMTEQEIEFELTRDVTYKDPQYLPKLQVNLEKLDFLQKSKKRAVVYGSVLDLEAWEELDKNMAARGIKEIDVAVCRPEGPFFEKNMTEEKGSMSDSERLEYGLVFASVFQQLHQRMNHQNGVIFMQIPEMLSKELLDKWIKIVSKKFGMSITVEKEERKKHYKKDNSFVVMCQYDGN